MQPLGFVTSAAKGRGWGEGSIHQSCCLLWIGHQWNPPWSGRCMLVSAGDHIKHLAHAKHMPYPWAIASLWKIDFYKFFYYIVCQLYIIIVPLWHCIHVYNLFQSYSSSISFSCPLLLLSIPSSSQRVSTLFIPCVCVCLSMSLIKLVYRNMGKGSYTRALTTYSGYSLPQAAVN